MITRRTVVIVPALNEETTIFRVVKSFARTGKHVVSEVLVIDGHSTDRTAMVAEEAGARVVMQKSSGKGFAMVEAVEQSQRYDVCVFIDGDGTYLPDEFDRVAGPVFRGEADMVVGSRINKNMEKGAMPRLNRFGNMLFSLIVKIVYQVPTSDVLSGYRAIRTDAFRSLGLKSRNFEVEAEMTVKALEKGLRVTEVPITYLRRQGRRTKLKPFKDGARIFKVLILQMLTN